LRDKKDIQIYYIRCPLLQRSWLWYWPLPGSGKIKGEDFSK
jgi:hypothetical protein